MAEDTVYTDIIKVVEPEQISPERIGQFSLERLATEFQSVLSRFEAKRAQMLDDGLDFDGRVLLVGRAGTDFETFANQLCREMPIKQARFKMDQIAGAADKSAEAVRVGFEFLRRSSPILFFMDRLESIASEGDERSVALQEELGQTSWSGDEVLIVAATSRLDRIDPDLLIQFNYAYVISETTHDDRVRVFERILKDRKDLDPSILAELTSEWSFSDVRNLATSFYLSEPQSDGQASREQMAAAIEKSGVIPIGNPSVLRRLARATEVGRVPRVEQVEAEYPDHFLDQLFLMSVSEDYAQTQRVIEVLNEGLPLSSDDREFLSRHPHLMTGSAEDRLMRLLRAKKSSDRLRRIAGR
ncbi:MAG: AAA family ATPase [Candidatus Thorarchaeota archaeon]